MEWKKFVLKIARVIFLMTIKLEDFDLDNILIDKKSHENIFIYDVSYKTLIDPKSLRIRFDKIDAFIRIYDGTRYLTFFGSEKYKAIYDRIGYLSLKEVASHIFFLFFYKNQSWFLWFFAYRKILTLHNVITHITSVLNKDKNHYYYQIFSENGHINYLKNNYKHFVCSMLMVKVGKTEIAKEKFYAAKKPIKI